MSIHTEVTQEDSQTLLGNNTFTGINTFSGPLVNTGTDSGNQLITGNKTFSGSNTFQSIQNIKIANASTTGGDCGARINTQDAALGSSSGEIWVDQSCGTTWTTAVVLGQSHVLRFTQGGVYTTNTISIGIFGAIVSDIPLASPSTVISSGANANVILLQANSTNGNPYITLSQQSAIHDIYVNGNKANNLIGGPCVQAIGIRTDWERIALTNCPSHGGYLGTAVGNNLSAGANLFKVWTLSNTGSGIFCSQSSDITLTGVQLETNSRYGWESTNCGTIRMVQGDVGFNTLGGITASCVLANPNPTTGEFQITSTNFGNQLGHDVFINDYDSVGANYCGGGHNISGNIFRGLGTGVTDNTFDGIKIQDSAAGSQIIANTFFSLATKRFKNAVEMTETSVGRAQEVIIWGNTFEGTLGTNDYITTANQALGINGSLGSYTGFSLIERAAAGSSCQNPANHDCLYANSVFHRWVMNNNNGGETPIVGQSTTDTLTNKTLNIPLPSGTGLQFFNTTTTCTTSASIGATCTTAAISLPAAEADTAYRVNCTGKGLTAVPVVIATTNSSATQFTITIAALTAVAASFTSYDCIVGHN